MKKLILKKGKEKPLLFHHHWIFSGAVKEIPPLDQGELVEVFSESGQKLGIAYTNAKGSLIGRMLSFGHESLESALEKAIIEAIELRKFLFNHHHTNAYRLINGEGDRIPGLIVDRYADHLIIQIGTKGIDLLKDQIVSLLKTHLREIKTIFEKSDLPTRQQEGLKSHEAILFGEINRDLVIKENGHQFKIDILSGQKTGFFLDQREMRCLVEKFSSGRTVLNCFSYSGGFSIYALNGRATKVRSVDISKKALETLEENLKLNQISTQFHESICEDVFEFLKKDLLQDDIVILDPPAFAKKKEDVVQACRGYKEINRQAMLKMKKGAILLTASCSYHVDETLFQQVLFQAASEAKREVKILSRHHLAMDHPINIYHREGEYLKSFVLEIQ